MTRASTWPRPLSLVRGNPCIPVSGANQPHLLTVVLAGLHRLFPWSVEAARILILAVASGLVACVHFGAARVASDNLPVHQTRVPRLLAGFGAALLLVSTDRIISISFAVDVGTPAVALAAVAACVLLSASGHQRRSLFFASGVLLALACAAKLFVGPLLPVFLISIAVVGTRNSQLQRGRYYGVPAALCWWSTGFLTTLVLLFGPTFSPEMIEQLVMPHFRYQAGRSPLSAGIFFPDWAVYVLLALGLPALWATRRFLSLPFLMWLAGYALALNLLASIRSSYHLLVLVPAVVLAGASLGSVALLAGRYRRFRPSATLGLTSLLLGFALLRLTAAAHWRTEEKPSDFSEEALQLLEGYDHHWMATSRQMLAFRAGLLVPPKLAVTSKKRFRSGFLDSESVLQVIEERRVAFVFESRRWPSELRKLLRKRLRRNYCVVMARPQVRLWQRRDLAGPGRCRRQRQPLAGGS